MSDALQIGLLSKVRWSKPVNFDLLAYGSSILFLYEADRTLATTPGRKVGLLINWGTDYHPGVFRTGGENMDYTRTLVTENCFPILRDRFVILWPVSSP